MTQYQETTIAQITEVVQSLLLESDLHLVVLTGIAVGVKCYPRTTFFQLQDETGSISGIIFSDGQGDQPLVDRTQIRATGTIGIYRGNLQLKVNHWDPIQTATDPVQDRLAWLAKKQLLREPIPLPTLSLAIGVISSLHAAGLGDFLKTLANQHRVIVYPSLVQGARAPAELVAAIQLANRHHLVDVLVLVRGGGSREDLNCFDETIVAKAILQSTIPVVTGIGHSIDRTLADLVADSHQITPTAAAESLRKITPSYQYRRILRKVSQILEDTYRKLAHYQQELQSHHLVLQKQQLQNSPRLRWMQLIHLIEARCNEDRDRLLEIRATLVAQREKILLDRSESLGKIVRYRSGLETLVAAGSKAESEYREAIRCAKMPRIYNLAGKAIDRSKDAVPGEYVIVFQDAIIRATVHR